MVFESSCLVGHSRQGLREVVSNFRALAIMLKKLGPDHVDVAASYSYLGLVHHKLGDFTEAGVIYLTIGVRAGGAGGGAAAPPQKIWGKSYFLGSKRNLGKASFLKMFSSFLLK